MLKYRYTYFKSKSIAFHLSFDCVVVRKDGFLFKMHNGNYYISKLLGSQEPYNLSDSYSVF